MSEVAQEDDAPDVGWESLRGATARRWRLEARRRPRPGLQLITPGGVEYMWWPMARRGDLYLCLPGVLTGAREIIAFEEGPTP